MTIQEPVPGVGHMIRPARVPMFEKFMHRVCMAAYVQVYAVCVLRAMVRGVRDAGDPALTSALFKQMVDHPQVICSHTLFIGVA